MKYWVGSTTQTQHQKTKNELWFACAELDRSCTEGYYTKGIDAAKGQRFLWLAEAKKDD